MTMMAEFKFKLGQKVRIKELEHTGTIRQCLIIAQGIQYEVRYFDRGDAKTVWFYEDEIDEYKM